MRALALALLTAALGFSQAQPSQPRTNVVTGQVVTGSGNDARPVRRAKVTLTDSSGTTHVTTTDTRGAYRLERQSEGRYRITIEKPGFITVTATVASDATLTLERAGAITGTVVDTAGTPIGSVAVSAWFREADGKTGRAAQSRTDDLGRYRLHSLAPGDYYVEVAADDVYRMVAGPMGRNVPDHAFYPAGLSLDDARRVRVLPGTDTTAVDFTLPAPLRGCQQAKPPTGRASGTARIATRVVDAASGRPAAGAPVVLVAVGGWAVMSCADAQGRFVVTGLDPGRYTLIASAERSIWMDMGLRGPLDSRTEIELRDGEQFTADFRLPRAGTLEGTVVDEFGDPAPNVTVRVARKQYAAGHQRLIPVTIHGPAIVTDDQGHYRIGTLQPGAYVVAGFTGAFAGRPEHTGFAPTYYPGTADAVTAIPIAIAAGVDSTATFALDPVHTVDVSGVMIDAAGKPMPGGTLWLMTPDREQSPAFALATTTTAADGRFRLTDVPPGTYTMQGFGPPAYSSVGPKPFGWRPLTIGDADLADVVLEVKMGTSLRGTIVMDDVSMPAPGAHQVNVSTVPVEFDSSPIGQAGVPIDFGVGPSTGNAPMSVTRDDRSFEVTRLTGLRRILVSVTSPVWTLERITLNGADITDTPQDFRTNNVEGVEIVLTSKVSRITGVVSDGKGPVDDCVVIIFPSDSAKWIDRSRFVTTARPRERGRFEVGGLPPEEYLAIALPDVADGGWWDPDFLQQLRADATSFDLIAGESKTLDLMLKRRPQ